MIFPNLCQRTFFSYGICLQSRPLDPDVVHPCLRLSVTMLKMMMTGWQDDRMTEDDKMTGWQDDRMTGWQNNRMTEWQNDRIWQDMTGYDRMTGWQDRVTEWPSDRVTEWPSVLVYLKEILTIVNHHPWHQVHGCILEGEGPYVCTYSSVPSICSKVQKIFNIGICLRRMTGWQDRVTKWLSDWVTEWPSDQVTKWPSGRVTEWPSDRVTVSFADDWLYGIFCYLNPEGYLEASWGTWWTPPLNSFN